MNELVTVSTFLLWIFVLLNFLLTIGLARRLNSLFPKRETLKPGQAAPGFSARTLTGQTVNLSDFLGSNVLLIFFSPDCSTCGEVLVSLRKFKETLESSKIKLLLIGDHDPESLLSYTSTLDLDFPVLSAPRKQNPLLADYKVVGVPSYCSIDKLGTVRAADFGAQEDIRTAINNLLGMEAEA